MDCQEYRVGRFILQPHRQLLDSGIPVSIRRKALELLSVLAKAEGTLVTKDELMTAVWPNAVVEDNALQVHIASLRKLLYADAGLLRTVHGFGYRLAATTVAARLDCQIEVQSVMDPGTARSRRREQTSLPSRECTGRVPSAALMAHCSRRRQSGNPIGNRSTTCGKVVRLAQTYSERAVLRLVELTQSGDERVALLASQTLLDRAYGKSWEFTELSPTDASAATEQRQELMAILVADLDNSVAATVSDYPGVSGAAHVLASRPWREG
jgi:DNA-binding winged helix-turn-helix (wHTH) protein